MDNQDTPDTPPNGAPAQDTQAQGAAPRPGANQLTTALIVIIVVLLFAMLLLTMNEQLFQAQQAKSTANDLTALETQNAKLRAEANAERARLGLDPLPADAKDVRAMADRIQRDATSLAAMANQWQTELQQKDEALQASDKEISGHTQNAQRLYAQNAALKAKLEQQADLANQVVRLTNDLKIANNQIADANQRLTQMQGRPTSEEAAQFRKQLTDSLEARNKLQLQVDKLMSDAQSTVPKQKYDDVLAELEQIKPLSVTQRYEIQRLRALLDRARLFIESEKDLPAEAARLFTKLRTLDNSRGADLTAAYKEIEATLGAKVIHRQTFETGSSQITFNRETMIKSAMGGVAGVDSFFLVVGYASKTGDADSNRKLSAARATTAASVVNLLKTPQQDVRAVYLGQTNRFSTNKPEDNQICEVWEIKR